MSHKLQQMVGPKVNTKVGYINITFVMYVLYRFNLHMITTIIHNSKKWTSP